MRRIESALWLLGTLLLTGCNEFRPTNCDPVTAQLVAHAYVLSNPAMGQENDLLPFMQSSLQSLCGHSSVTLMAGVVASVIRTTWPAS